MVSYARRAKEFGFQSGQVEYDFAEVMERVQRVIEKVEPHDSIERYTGLGVECFTGAAKITSPWTVEVNGQTLTTRNIIIATGASPFVPPITGIEKVDYLTSDNLWQLRQNPGRLVVLGGGPIGSEMTQAMARLGAEVTQVEMMPRIMGREDPEVSEYVQKQFESRRDSCPDRSHGQRSDPGRGGEDPALRCRWRDGQRFLSTTSLSPSVAAPT